MPNFELKRAILREHLAHAGSRFVAITFIKKDGTPRTITTCNTATVGLKGDEASAPAQQAAATRAERHPHLINRYDVHKMGWRSINLDTVTRLKMEGFTFDWTDPK